MARSQQSFNKSEREKKRLKKREEKRKKKEERNAAKEEKGGIPFAYVDEFGNLTDTPVDKSQREQVEAEDIEISIPKKEKEEIDPVRKGKVAFFNDSKGYGFIVDLEDNEKYFTHVSGLIDDIQENDKVTFELEKGLKGMNAVKVTLAKTTPE